MLKKLAFLLTVLLLAGQSQAQERPAPSDSLRIVEFSGTLLNDSLQPVSFATVQVLHKRRGTIADFWGYFYLPVEVGDTIVFASVGYKKAYHVVPADAADNYQRNVHMKLDNILLGEVLVLPWHNYEQFKQAFIALELPKDDYETAIVNFEVIMTQVKMNEYATTSSMGHRNYMRSVANQNYYAGGQQPTINMNPLAWAQLIEAIRSGAFRRH